MKLLTLLLAMAVSVRAEPMPGRSIDRDAPSVSAFDAEQFVGREITITGRPPCIDFIDRSLKYGLLDRRKKTVFRVLVRIPDIDVNAYLRKIANGPDFTVHGRIEWEAPFQKAVTTGWDWEGGAQIVVTSPNQIRVVSPSK